MIVLSYLWILALVPFLVEKEDQEVKWHARHGLVLTALEIVIWVALGILASIPAIGCVALILWPLFGLGALIFRIFLIVKGANGERVLVPYVSDFADRL